MILAFGQALHPTSITCVNNLFQSIGQHLLKRKKKRLGKENAAVIKTHVKIRIALLYKLQNSKQ